MKNFKIGDRVRVSQDHPAEEWRGLVGTVTYLPNGGFKGWFHIQTEEKGVGGFQPMYLSYADEPQVGDILKREDVTVGMEIEVHHNLEDVDCTRRGVVSLITNEYGTPQFYSEARRLINFTFSEVKGENITLLDLPADPLPAELAELGAGSVVQREDMAGESTLTFSYIKSTSKGVWHFYNPSGPSRNVTESDVLGSIKNKGAQIVIRK